MNPAAGNDRPPCAILAPVYPGTDRPFGKQTLLVMQASDWLGTEIPVVSPAAASRWPAPAPGVVWRRGTAVAVEVPLPRAIWDRKTTRSPGEIDQFRQLCRLCSDHGIPILNLPAFSALTGDKWRAHAFFRRHKLPSLPTVMAQQALLAPWLRRGLVVWIKPRSGSKGEGIWRIDPQLERRQPAAAHEQDARTLSLSSLSSLPGLLDPAAAIAQLELPVPRFLGRVWDARLLLQRGSRGSWELTYACGRLAARGCHVANLAQRASVTGLPEILNPLFARRAPEVLRRIERLAFAVGAAIDYEFGASRLRIAETGIDILVNHHGYPFIVELNSKPGRSAHLAPAASGLPPLRRAAVLRPIRWILQGNSQQ